MNIRPKSPDSFTMQGSETGILLVHGFTGSAAEMRPLGFALNRAGYTVHAPLLKGHGTTPDEMRQTTDDDWWQSVLAGYDVLVSAGCTTIYAVGLSMGGILSLKLAMEKDIKAVVTLCAPIFVRDKNIRFAGALKYIVPFMKRKSQKPQHIEDEIIPYDRTPLVSVQNLYGLIRSVSRRLAEVHCPILVVQARNDETIQPRSGQFIYDHVGSDDKEMKWYENSSHIITVDREREQLFRDILAFIGRFA